MTAKVRKSDVFKKIIAENGEYLSGSHSEREYLTRALIRSMIRNVVIGSYMNHRYVVESEEHFNLFCALSCLAFPERNYISEEDISELKKSDSLKLTWGTSISEEDLSEFKKSYGDTSYGSSHGIYLEIIITNFSDEEKRNVTLRRVNSRKFSELKSEDLSTAPRSALRRHSVSPGTRRNK
ncbi:MAG: hypothetical protein LBI61_03135 [Puniceicoccales bacterium]|nr:hypothetical protein [Puniceicoccales bacterium]